MGDTSSMSPQRPASGGGGGGMRRNPTSMPDLTQLDEEDESPPRELRPAPLDITSTPSSPRATPPDSLGY